MTQQEYYAEAIRAVGTALLERSLERAERRERRAGGTDAAWVVDALRAELSRRTMAVPA